MKLTLCPEMHSYMIEYTIGKERVISYLDYKAKSDEYINWVDFHKRSIRDRTIDIYINKPYDDTITDNT